MAYQVPVLDGYEYPYAPVQNQNPKVKQVVATDTMNGRYFTDWGTQPSRQEIVQTWPTVEASFFATLEAKALEGGTLSYTDDDGTDYIVIALPPTYNNKLPGGIAFEGVTFKMLVVSSP